MEEFIGIIIVLASIFITASIEIGRTRNGVFLFLGWIFLVAFLSETIIIISKQAIKRVMVAYIPGKRTRFLLESVIGLLSQVKMVGR